MAKGRKKRAEKARSKNENSAKGTQQQQQQQPAQNAESTTTGKTSGSAKSSANKPAKTIANEGKNPKTHQKNPSTTASPRTAPASPVQWTDVVGKNSVEIVLNAEMLNTGGSPRFVVSPPASTTSSVSSGSKSSGSTRRKKKSKARKNNDEKASTKATLTKHFSTRPDKEDLVNRGIMKSRGMEVVKEDLEKKISARRDIHDLQRAGIMPKHGHVVHDVRKELIRQNKHAHLNNFLKHRPPVHDLVRDSVIHDTMMWSYESQSGGVIPTPRNCHTSTVIKDKMYLLGGYGMSGSASKSSELLILDMPTKTWNRPLVAGVVPIERYAHVCVPIDTNLVMFGGFSVDGVWMNDLNILDTNYKQDFFPSLGKYTDEQKTNRLEQMFMWWQPPVTGVPPTPRAAMSAIAHERKIYFFGGNDDGLFFNDVHVLDTDRMHWISPRCSGTPPCPRAGHTASLVGDKTMVIFGGGEPDRPLNDIHFLDLETMEWSEPTVYGTAPSPRAGHTASVICGTWLVVFGGGYLSKVNNDLHIFDTDTCTWQRPSDSGIVPVQRGGHSCFCLDDTLYFFGGADVNGDVFNDLHILDTSFFRSRSSNLITLPPDNEPTNVIPAPPPVEQVHKKRQARYVSELAETDELVEQIEHTTNDFRENVADMKSRIQDQQRESDEQVQKMFKILTDVREKQFELLLEEVEQFEATFIEKLNELKASLQTNILVSRSRASSRTELPTELPTPPIVDNMSSVGTQDSTSSSSPTPPNTRKNSDLAAEMKKPEVLKPEIIQPEVVTKQGINVEPEVAKQGGEKAGKVDIVEKVGKVENKRKTPKSGKSKSRRSVGKDSRKSRKSKQGQVRKEENVSKEDGESVQDGKSVEVKKEAAKPLRSFAAIAKLNIQPLS